ncbi:hypothetical protein ACX80U_12020 [Arthrobacter sp. TmT3-37]
MHDLLLKADDWQTRLGRNHVPELMTGGTVIITIALGLAMILTAETFMATATFRKNFEFARPETWGVVMILTSVLLLVGFLARSDGARYAALVVTGIYALFGALAGYGPLTGTGGVLSAGIVYTGLGFFTLVTMLVIGARTRVDRS